MRKYKHHLIGFGAIFTGIIMLIFIYYNILNVLAVQTGTGIDILPSIRSETICDMGSSNCVSVANEIMTYHGSYIMLREMTSEPPSEDCDESSERRRATYYNRPSGVDRFYICTDDGWKYTLFN